MPRFLTSPAAGEAIAAIAAAPRLYVTAHITPDGDTVGSALGLYWALTGLGKHVRVACADPVPDIYQFLPGSELIRALKPQADELLVIPDSSDLSRLGALYDSTLFANRTLINIDHHVTNVRFGSINWIEPRAASTAEIMVEMCDGLNAPIDERIATCLLTGIATDTLVFRTSSTTPELLEVAARLVRTGAPLTRIVEETFNTRNASDLSLQGKILANMLCEDGLVWADNTVAMRREAGASENGSSGIGTLLLSTRGARVSVVFIEKGENVVEVSFRSRPGCDISRIAFGFGGGGHPQAAGCTLQDTLSGAHERVLPAVRELLKSGSNGRS